MADKQVLVDTVSSSLTYVGEAELGTPTTSKRWKIKKILVSGTVTSVTYPIGKVDPLGTEGFPSSEFEFAWDDRSALTYSLVSDVTAPALSTVSIASDNSDTTKAKVGDTVTVSIVSSELVQNVVMTINGHAATVTKGVDDLHWSGAYDMVSGDTEGVVTFTVDYEDQGGNDGLRVTAVTDASSVTFDKTAPTAAITYSKDGGSNYYSTASVKDSDTLIIKATFSEALLDSPVVKVAVSGGVLAATNMTKVSTTVYTYSLNVPAGDVATATVSLSVGTDASGNVVTAAPTSGSTFSIDNTLPTLSSAVKNTVTQITVTLSELALASTITKANDGGFVVTETGGAPTYAVSAIAPGATDDLVVLTVADMTASASAGVTVTYAAAGNGTVTDKAGNALATDATGVVIAAW